MWGRIVQLLEVWALGTVIVGAVILAFWSGRMILERQRRDRS